MVKAKPQAGGLLSGTGGDSPPATQGQRRLRVRPRLGGRGHRVAELPGKADFSTLGRGETRRPRVGAAAWGHAEILDPWGPSGPVELAPSPLGEASSPPLLEDHGEASVLQGDTCPSPLGSPPPRRPMQ